MTVWKKMTIVIALIGMLGLKILQNSESRCVIQSGNVNEFWFVACGVDVDGSGRYSGLITELLPATDGWAHYSIYGYCGSRYYRVRLVDAAAQLSRVIPLVNAKRQDGSLPEVISTCFDFRADGQFSGDDAGRFANDVRHAQLQHLKSTAPERVIHYQRSEQLFSDHLERSKRYWLTLLFEFSWLSGVIILTALPWLRNGGPLAWTTCVGGASLLLFCPVWCGYCSYTFTSCFPDGGVFYPDVVRRFPVFFEARQIDSWLIQHCPVLFDAVSQHPISDVDSARRLFPPPGPTGVLLTVVSLLLCAHVVLAIVRLRYRRVSVDGRA